MSRVTDDPIRPFLKWAGGKYRIIERIRELLPEGERLVEPFVGSGAVFLNTRYPTYLLADSNPDLINLYRILQTEGEAFIAYCKRNFTARNNSPESYYRLRDVFNTTRDLRRKSALFVYLNRHGYNGLCRYNAKGRFNCAKTRAADTSRIGQYRTSISQDNMTCQDRPKTKCSGFADWSGHGLSEYHKGHAEWYSGFMYQQGPVDICAFLWCDKYTRLRSAI